MEIAFKSKRNTSAGEPAITQSTLRMNCPQGVFLVITSYIAFKTRVTKLSVTSSQIRKAMRYAALTNSSELVRFEKAWRLYNSRYQDEHSLFAFTNMLKYAIAVAPQVKLVLSSYDDLCRRNLIEIILEYGQNLKQNKI